MNKEMILQKLHTTERGEERVRRNLKIEGDVIAYCRNLINRDDAVIDTRGKNIYVEVQGVVMTIHEKAGTLITAHPKKV